MEYLVTQAEMKQYDNNTITYLKIPSVVLMERAALVTAEQIRKEKGNANFRVLVAAGCGNNGGDGLAVGRLLMLQGCSVDFVLFGAYEKCSRETTLQLDILMQYGCKIFDRIPECEYDIVVDALFGIGLSREIDGIYKEAVSTINAKNAYVCAVDIPSGVDADTGRILGCAVQADLTVTYGFYKAGEFLYPGTGYCGKIICGQMGIDKRSFLGKKPFWYTYTSLSDMHLVKRRPDGNKGTFGKALVIAGSDTICGAALLAARSVFKTGAGMVRVVTSVKNRETFQQTLPEAMLTLYDTIEDSFLEAFKTALDWADGILIGPGIGTGKEAEWMLDYCLKESELSMVMDADALNLLAKKDISDLPYTRAGRQIIITPHLGEFAGLYGCTIPEASDNITVYPHKLADKLNCIVVCKDARTVVTRPDAETAYINTAGNAGMATAGSGDVLAGVITGLLVQGMDAWEAAKSGVYLHSVAGDMAAKLCGEHSMMATDIIEQIQRLFKEIEWQSDSNGSLTVRVRNDSTMVENKRIYAKVDLDALCANVEAIRNVLNPGTKIMAIIKANGYGHGAVPIGKELETFDAVFGYGVATAEEAFALRKAGLHKPVLILGYTFPNNYEALIEQDISMTVFRYDTLEELSACAARLGKKAKVHIKVDTGMSRIGIFPDESGLKFVKKALSYDELMIEGVFTHFARADETDKTSAEKQFDQISQFWNAIETQTGYRIPWKHCANSAGIMELQKTHMDMVRAGIILYGMWPSEEVEKETVSIQPVLSLKSRIVHIKQVAKGTPVSYGGTYVTDKELRIATIPVGYADGYPRSLSGKGYVLIHGKKAPILGRICMDQFMVSVEDIPEAQNGSEVTLIGKDDGCQITMEELGDLSGRFNYEFACGLGERVPRIYIKKGEICAYTFGEAGNTIAVS